MTDKDLQTAYQAIEMQPAWRVMARDLLDFALAEKDPVIRCGRLDMLAHIQDALSFTPEEA
jgi:hypothetical protein